MRNEGDCCGTCECWVVCPGSCYVEVFGTCRAEIPSVQHYGRTAWPETEPSEWCRKHESKDSLKLRVVSLHQPQDLQSGISAVIGKWPVNETDEDIDRAFQIDGETAPETTEVTSCSSCGKVREVNYLQLCGECSDRLSEFLTKRHADDMRRMKSKT